MRTPSSVSSVTLASSSNVPSGFAVTQSPPLSTVPRRRSPSNDPPTIGKIRRVPLDVDPISWVGKVSKRSSMSGREFMASEHLVNRVDRPFAPTVAARHGNDSIQERVRRVPGREARRGTKIIRRRVDGLAAADGGNHIRRSVTNATRSHRNERAVVGLERRQKIQLENTVGSQQQPVRTCSRQELPAK